MATMSITLPDEAKAFLEEQVAAEGYASVSDYLGAIIREVRLRKAKLALEAKLREAIESGPATPMTREDWDELERRVWERHIQAQNPS